VPYVPSTYYNMNREIFQFVVKFIFDLRSRQWNFFENFWWHHRWTQNTWQIKFLVLTTRTHARTQAVSSLPATDCAYRIFRISTWRHRCFLQEIFEYNKINYFNMVSVYYYNLWKRIIAFTGFVYWLCIHLVYIKLLIKPQLANMMIQLNSCNSNHQMVSKFCSINVSFRIIGIQNLLVRSYKGPKICSI